MKDVRKIIAKQLKIARESANLTQNELADLLHMERGSYAQYETGRNLVPIDRLFHIANILETPVYILLDIPVNNLTQSETDLLYIYRRIPAHMQETALDLLRVLIQVPAPADIPADPPPTEIAEAIGNLDPQQQEQVLDFVDFLTEPRIQQLLHQKQRRRDIQRSIDIIDLYLAVCEATPEERERLINNLLFQLQGG